MAPFLFPVRFPAHPPPYSQRSRTARSESYEDRRGIRPTATAIDGDARHGDQSSTRAAISIRSKALEPGQHRSSGPRESAVRPASSLSPAANAPLATWPQPRKRRCGSNGTSCIQGAPQNPRRSGFPSFPWRRRRCGNVVNRALWYQRALWPGCTSHCSLSSVCASSFSSGEPRHWARKRLSRTSPCAPSHLFFPTWNRFHVTGPRTGDLWQTKA